MSRWRPPQPGSSPYITPAGYQSLQDELPALWRRRAGVVQALAAAAAEGDRSENAEYTYRKKELAGLDRRIRYLQKRLPELRVVREVPDGERIFFGASVRLERDDSQEVEYRIVGADETDAQQGWISIDSPLARALLGRSAGDEVEVQLPAGRELLRVIAVTYVATGAL